MPARRAPERATMHDVARRAEVSIKTVSRVVNGEPGVSEALATRVRTAVQELGYRHNLAASNLRRGQRTASIGVLVDDLGNAFCSEVLRAIEDRARGRGIVLLASSTDEDVDRERELIDGLLSRRIDGMIVMPTGRDQRHLTVEHADGVPVVTVDRRPADPGIDGVVVDNAGGARTAVAHLLAHGHRRIGILGDASDIVTALERRDGYRRALADAGLPHDPALERLGARTREEASAHATELLALADPPTAFFAARNVLCTGVVDALRRQGRSHEVGLVGFDDVPLAELLDPPVTVIRQDTRAIGEQAMDLLLARLDGDQGPGRVVDLPTELVVRGSGEIPAPAVDRG
ncbi:transcriptional regulator, LacI family [Nocardioides scoriae]|uniref:Transcriptional regulator, LacI family n=1 Tax=Nocardioides scoriae TaxID=642780 RepID=A0A1H1PZR0_9ACTN|nr:transcriptional regulator, LacI family [Nocardioides scoriae]